MQLRIQKDKMCRWTMNPVSAARPIPLIKKLNYFTLTWRNNLIGSCSFRWTSRSPVKDRWERGHRRMEVAARRWTRACMKPRRPCCSQRALSWLIIRSAQLSWEGSGGEGREDTVETPSPIGARWKENSPSPGSTCQGEGWKCGLDFPPLSSLALFDSRPKENNILKGLMTPLCLRLGWFLHRVCVMRSSISSFLWVLVNPLP